MCDLITYGLSENLKFTVYRKFLQFEKEINEINYMEKNHPYFVQFVITLSKGNSSHFPAPPPLLPYAQ